MSVEIQNEQLSIDQSERNSTRIVTTEIVSPRWGSWNICVTFFYKRYIPLGFFINTNHSNHFISPERVFNMRIMVQTIINVLTEKNKICERRWMNEHRLRRSQTFVDGILKQYLSRFNIFFRIFQPIFSFLLHKSLPRAEPQYEKNYFHFYLQSEKYQLLFLW